MRAGACGNPRACRCCAWPQLQPRFRAEYRCGALAPIVAPMLWGVPSSPTPEQPPGTGIPDSKLPGPYPVGEYAAALRTRLRAFARVQVMGEIVNLRPSRAKVYFELRDSGGALPCSAWRARVGVDVRARRRRPRRRDAGRARGRLRLLRGQRHLLAGILLRRQRPARCRRGRPARPHRPPAQAARPGGAAGDPAGAGARAAAAHDRRDHRRGRQGPRRRARGAHQAWLGRPPGLGLHPRPGPPRRPRDRPGTRRPGVSGRGRRDHRRSRGRLAGGPARVLRRDALPHRGPAACARDRVGGPPHRPHPSRRRGGGELLDPDPCGRGRRRYRLHQGASRPGRGRGPPSRPRPPGGARARPAPGDALAGTRSPHLRPPLATCISSCARSVPDRAGAWRARAA